MTGSKKFDEFAMLKELQLPPAPLPLLQSLNRFQNQNLLLSQFLSPNPLKLPLLLKK